MEKTLICPECNSKKINQYRMMTGKIWCGDCGFSAPEKEKHNPFLQDAGKPDEGENMNGIKQKLADIVKRQEAMDFDFDGEREHAIACDLMCNALINSCKDADKESDAHVIVELFNQISARP